MKRMRGGIQSSSLAQQGRGIVERLGGIWRQGGGMCRCPAHDDRSPSLSVRVGERRLLFHCFAGCETAVVIRALVDQRLLEPGLPADGIQSPASPADPGARNRHAAAALWTAARLVEGTAAEDYLLGRGLALAVADLRFHPRTPLGRGVNAVFRPAMVAAVRDDSGLVAVHRTFLKPSAPGLADMPRSKRALGRLGEGAVRLRPAHDHRLGLAEGVETAMAATLVTGIPCWATLGAARFGRVALPPNLTRLVLFLDNDSAGRRAEALMRQALHPGGATLDVRYSPRPGTDWNDLLLERA